VVKLLVGAGAKVEQQAGDWTPLVQAAISGRLHVVKYLVEEAGADVQRAGCIGWTPLMWAVDEGHTDVVGYLLSRPDIKIDAKTPAGESMLLLACRPGHLEVMRLLVGAGAKVNPQASDEYGSLGDAALNGHLHVVKYLVEEAGADVLRVDPDGRTPLMRAAERGHTDVAAYLQPIVLRHQQEVGVLQLANSPLIYLTQG
jgi:ankyrin repeat protein